MYRSKRFSNEFSELTRSYSPRPQTMNFVTNSDQLKINTISIYRLENARVNKRREKKKTLENSRFEYFHCLNKRWEGVCIFLQCFWTSPLSSSSVYSFAFPLSFLLSETRWRSLIASSFVLGLTNNNANRRWPYWNDSMIEMTQWLTNFPHTMKTIAVIIKNKTHETKRMFLLFIWYTFSIIFMIMFVLFVPIRLFSFPLRCSLFLSFFYSFLHLFLCECVIIFETRTHSVHTSNWTESMR